MELLNTFVIDYINSESEFLTLFVIFCIFYFIYVCITFKKSLLLFINAILSISFKWLVNTKIVLIFAFIVLGTIVYIAYQNNLYKYEIYDPTNHHNTLSSPTPSATPFPEQSYIYSKTPEYDNKSLEFSQGKKRYLVFTSPIQKVYVKSIKTPLENLKVYHSSAEKLREFMIYENDPKNKEEYKDNYYSYITNHQYIFKNKSIRHDNSELYIEIPIRPELDKYTQIDLNLPVGVYYLDATNKLGSEHVNIFLIVNTQGLMVRFDDQKVTASLINAQSGQKSDPDGVLEIYNTESTPKLLKSERIHSLTQFDLSIEKHPNLAMAKIGSEIIVAPMIIHPSDSNIVNRVALDKNIQVFLATDRPLYAVGEKIKFFGIVRMDNDAIYKIPPSQEKIVVKYEYDRSDYKNTKEESAEITIDSHGRFFGELEAKKPNSANPSVYIHAFVKNANLYNDKSSGFEIDISEFNKPDIDLQVTPSSEKVTGISNASFQVNQVKLGNKPLKKQLVSYTMYAKSTFQSPSKVNDSNFNIISAGGMCGEGGFDEWYGDEIKKGEFELGDSSETISVDWESFKYRNTTDITLVAKTTDEHKNEIIASSIISYAPSDWKIFTSTNSLYFEQAKNVSDTVSIESSDGHPVVDAKINYNITQVFSSYEPTPTSFQKFTSQGEIITDNDGIAKFDKKLPSGTYEVDFIIVDSHDQKIFIKKTYRVGSENITYYNKYLERKNKKGPVSFTANKSTYTEGDQAIIEFNAPGEIDIFLTSDRGRIYQPQIFRTASGKSFFKLQITEELSPSFSLIANYFYNGAYYSQGINFNVPAMHKLLKLSLKTDKLEYKSGDLMKIYINSRNRQNVGVGANIVVSIVDKSIFVLKKNTTPPLHSSFYYARESKVNSSSSLGLVGEYDQYGDGWGGGGGEGNPSAFNKEVNTLYYNPTLETDNNGELYVEVPLPNQKTTWRISAYAFTDSTDLGQNNIDVRVE